MSIKLFHYSEKSGSVLSAIGHRDYTLEQALKLKKDFLKKHPNGKFEIIYK